MGDSGGTEAVGELADVVAPQQLAHSAVASVRASYASSLMRYDSSATCTVTVCCRCSTLLSTCAMSDVSYRACRLCCVVAVGIGEVRAMLRVCP